MDLQLYWFVPSEAPLVPGFNLGWLTFCKSPVYCVPHPHTNSTLKRSVRA